GLGGRRVRVREEALRASARPRPGRARLHHHLPAEEDRGRAPRVGERGTPRGPGGRRRGRDRLSPISFLAEPQVTWVDANVKRKGTEAAAKAYLEFLYTEEGQKIIAKNFYRPIDPAVRQRYAAEFPEIKVFPITAIAKSWDAAYVKFFNDGGLFDSFYKPKQ